MSDELRDEYPVQEFLHIGCDCVPEYGPSHCHLCSGDGQPVEWPCRFAASMDAFVVRRVAEATKWCRAELAAVRVREGQANYLLARVVAAANVGAVDGEDGFIERYDMPVGPIHKAIPFLSEAGIVVTLDGRIMNSPTTIAALAVEQEGENDE